MRITNNFWKLSSLSAIVMIAALAVGRAQAVPVSLADLIATDGTITVGDKLFSDFSGSLSGSGNFTPQSIAGIFVDGITTDGLFGLRFSGGLIAFANPQTTISNLDVLIGYTVTVLNPSALISDIHLSFNGAATANASTSVTETVFNEGAEVIGQASVTNPPPNFTDVIILAQFLAQVDILKDIQLFAFSTGGSSEQATISFVDQYVSQTVVPEPASLLLLGTALAGLGLGRWRSPRAVGSPTP